MPRREFIGPYTAAYHKRVFGKSSTGIRSVDRGHAGAGKLNKTASKALQKLTPRSPLKGIIEEAVKTGDKNKIRAINKAAGSTRGRFDIENPLVENLFQEKPVGSRSNKPLLPYGNRKGLRDYVESSRVAYLVFVDPQASEGKTTRYKVVDTVGNYHGGDMTLQTARDYAKLLSGREVSKNATKRIERWFEGYE